MQRNRNWEYSPHLKHIAYGWRNIYLHIHGDSCLIKRQYGFISSSLLVFLTSCIRTSAKEIWKWPWCALFVITSIFKPAREKKKWRQVKKHFAKCNFQHANTIRREEEKRDYSRNFSKWHDSVNTFTT